MMKSQRTEYPRPDFQRESFLSLNGEWDFAYDDENLGVHREWYRTEYDGMPMKINVPFTYLCEMSGIDSKEFHDIVWYRKQFDYHKSDACSRVLLHFGAIDDISDVWVNGHHVVAHTGGNTPICADITEYMTEQTQVITVRAFDDSGDFEIARGKQYWKESSESIFYTRTVGIWQPVWLEEVNAVYLTHSKVTSFLDEREVLFELDFSEAGDYFLELEITLKGVSLIKDRMQITSRRMKRRVWLDSSLTQDWNHHESYTWSPENPVLFDVSYRVIDAEGRTQDAVKSYFAFRKISIVGGEIMLNNRPYYMKMLLDQGYWRKSLLTAPSDEAFKDDILNAKKMGFNGVRKHQKIEDPRFLYWADQLGFLVWGECPSSYEYSDRAVRRHEQELADMIDRDYNHPCIIAWVPLNESWGVFEIADREDEQAHALSLYYLCKSLDQTRLVISNDGWMHTKSDIISIHDYIADHEELVERYDSVESIRTHFPGGRPLFARGYEYHGEPFMVTEFGGISYCTDRTKGWGYSSAKDQDEFLQLYRGVVSAMLQSKHVKGFVYTQLTDVEQEINGLMTYDREFKVDPELIKAINEGH